MGALQHRPRLMGFRDYQGALTESVYPMRLDLPGSADAFKAQLSLARIGSIDMVRAQAGSSFHCMQEPAVCNATEPRLILKMQLKGSTSYRHMDRDLRCCAGDIALFSDANIIEGEQHGAADALVVKLPISRIRMAAPAILSGLGQVITTGTPSGRLLAMTLREVWSMVEKGQSYAPDSLSAAVLNLIDASISDNANKECANDIVKADERFRRIRDLIDSRCAKPNLMIAELARDLAMSRSTMYETVQAAGTTIERLVREARVEKAMAILSDPSQAHVTITALAYDLGFKHPSHLTRAFAGHTGESPLAFRRKVWAVQPSAGVKRPH